MSPPVRRIDLFACLSLATDLALGQNQNFALKSCLLGARLGEAARASDQGIAGILYQALLRYIGCNADTHLMSALLGDEYVFRREFARIDNGRGSEVLPLVLRALHRRSAGASLTTTALTIVQGLMRAEGESRAILSGHCEVAERLAARLGLPDTYRKNLGQLYERWDGRGIPHGLKGEAIALPVRIVTLAQDAIVLTEAFGFDAAMAMIRERRGGAYDPNLTDLFVAKADRLMSGLAQGANAEAIRRLEPAPQAVLSEAEVDAACLVIADMTDLRMPQSLGHSRAVADLAEAAARALSLPQADLVLTRRAGLVHDIGELLLPVSAWTRPGPFSETERDIAHLHPLHSERILTRAGGTFDQIGLIAGRHHERLDGSGYHRGLRGTDLPLTARILAAAEACRSWIEPRPHRTALAPATAASRLNAEMRAGRVCREAGGAVLAALGQPQTRPGQTLDLTAREVEVLRLLTEGRTIKGVALHLGIATKTADNHVQNLYSKLGVTTRAAAVLWAVERGLHQNFLSG